MKIKEVFFVQDVLTRQYFTGSFLVDQAWSYDLGNAMAFNSYDEAIKHLKEDDTSRFDNRNSFQIISIILNLNQ